MASLHPDLASRGIEQFLDALRVRWVRVKALECGLWAFVASALVALILALVTDLPPFELLVSGVAAGILVLLVASAWLRACLPDDNAIARMADRRLELAEKLSSTLELYRFGPVHGLVATALLAATGKAIAGLDPRRFEAWFSVRRIGLSLGAVIMLAALSVVLLWPSSAPGDLTVSEISRIAQIFAEDAEVRGDDQLATIAEELEDLAARVDRTKPESLASDLEALFARTSSRFGSNPAHNWPPFEGASSGLADRIEAFRENRDGSGPLAGSQPAGNASETPAGGDVPADDIRASSLPTMGEESISLGLAPPEGQTDGSALEGDDPGHDAQMADNQMHGQAEGAGSGLSNFAGEGEAEGEIPTEPAVTAGFEEVRELSAARPVEGTTTRIGMETDERATVVEDSGMARTWPRLESVPTERTPIPDLAASAVERYFARNRDEAL